MGPKWFKVPSKCLLIYWICWFSIVRKIWGFLANSHTPINANENLENKPYFRLCLLSNLANLLRPVYSRSKFLGIFDPFSPSQDDIPLGTLGDRRAKFFFIFDVFRTTLETGHWITSDTDAPLMIIPSFNCCMVCNNVIIFLLFYSATLGTWVGVLLVSSSMSGVNQVTLRSKFSGAPLYELRCTRSVQFGGIVPSLMNGAV